MTMTKEKKMTITCNIICAVMIVVFLAAFIFLPFWSYTSVETSAITGDTVTEDRTNVEITLGTEKVYNALEKLVNFHHNVMGR